MIMIYFQFILTYIDAVYLCTIATVKDTPNSDRVELYVEAHVFNERFSYSLPGPLL